MDRRESEGPDKALEISGAKTRGFVVATVADAASTDAVRNWASHLRNVGTPHVVGCLSRSLLRSITSDGSAAFIADGPESVRSGPTHSTPQWKEFALARVFAMGKLLDFGVSVLMSDSDVAFLQSPGPCLAQLDSGIDANRLNGSSSLCEQLQGADVAISSDNLAPERDAAQGASYAAGGLFNTGITFMKNSSGGRRWHSAWVEHLRPASDSVAGSFYSSMNTDQQVFNAMLRAPRTWPGTGPPSQSALSRDAPLGARVLQARGPGRANGTLIGALPLKRFAHGHSYFIRGLREQPVAVHATYSLDTAASDSKKLRMQENGLWRLLTVPEAEILSNSSSTSGAKFVTYEPQLSTRERAGSAGISNHLSALAIHASELRGALGVARALGRWLVVPYRLYCNCDRVWGGHDNVFSRNCRYPGSEEVDFVPFRCPLDHIAFPSRWRAHNEHIVPEKAISSSALFSDVLRVPIGLKYRPDHNNALRDWSSLGEIKRKFANSSRRTIMLTGNVPCAFGGDTENINNTRLLDRQFGNLLQPPEFCSECLPKRCSEWIPQSVYVKGRIIPTRSNTQEMFCVQVDAPMPLAPRLQPTLEPPTWAHQS
jgi:hypothetical protein